MTTAQEIREKTFERAIRGYDIGSVDEFLDQMAADFTAMEKENAALKSKMRVLVEKIEEYRQTEDSMRLALLSAQKMSSDIETEARQKADALLTQARQKADSITKGATDNIRNEELKLAEAKKATQKFIEHMSAVCSKQMEFYEKLADIRLVGTELAKPAPVQEKEPDPVPAPAPAPVPASAPAFANAKKRKETDGEDTDESENTAGDEEPTRLFSTEAAKKKKHSYEEFRFDDNN
jgi:cell division initiation protein